MRTHSIISFNCPRFALQSLHEKCNLITASILLAFGVIIQASSATAQQVLFDFDGAPIHASLPIDQTAGGITAHLSATGQGYSIQAANVLGFTPPGFSGLVIYPNSINLSDLLIKFDQALSDFSIMYSVHELACDTSATMRVTAYTAGSYVGANTMVARFPGTWPVDTLSCSFPQGFDSVVVHYDITPRGCQDYGTIFMADNMKVIPMGAAGVADGELPGALALRQNYPNPFNPTTTIRYTLPAYTHVSLRIFDLLGREVATLVNGLQPPGERSVTFDGSGLGSGVYYYRLQAGTFVESKKLMLMR